MDSAEIDQYFASIQAELTGGQSSTSVAAPRREIEMSYFSTKLVSRAEYCPGLFKIELEKLPKDYEPGELAGKYFFLTVPGIGEKPFAIFSAAERSVIVRNVGVFTRFLEEAERRHNPAAGPLRRAAAGFEKRVLVMVGGGTGTASLLEIARAYRGRNGIIFLLGARNGSEFYDLDLFREIGGVSLATDDGSTGYHGLVSGLLQTAIDSSLRDRHEELVFLNCGPGPMISRLLPNSTGARTAGAHHRLHRVHDQLRCWHLRQVRLAFRRPHLHRRPVS